MSQITRKYLEKFIPNHKFFVGIDSDGCVFDTMELKHKECFCPQYINCFDLQAVSKYAREVWEFVNLYSRTRGYNRFRALLTALELLADRQEVRKRRVNFITCNSLRSWIERAATLSSPALKMEIDLNRNRELQLVWEWSNEVNMSVRKIVRNVPPFPLVKKSLQRLQQSADIIVVSQATSAALQQEWNEHKIDKFAHIICGQEQGTKSEHITLTAGSKYDAFHMLMIGDAPGDMNAAKENNALFFPIIPGSEEESWQRFYTEGMHKFFTGSYSGEYEEYLIDKFENALPEIPTWKSEKTA